LNLFRVLNTHLSHIRFDEKTSQNDELVAAAGGTTSWSLLQGERRAGPLVLLLALCAANLLVLQLLGCCCWSIGRHKAAGPAGREVVVRTVGLGRASVNLCVCPLIALVNK